MNTFFLFRHAEPVINASIQPNRWPLSANGKRICQQLAERANFQQVSVFYSSTELKAIQTAKFISKLQNNNIKEFHDFREVDREYYEVSKDKFLKKQRLYFKNLEKNDFGWETGNKALYRFHSTLNIINDAYNEKKILVVSHGTILSLYFADLLGILSKGNDIFKRWNNMDFCSYGIVKAGQVIKDIV